MCNLYLYIMFLRRERKPSKLLVTVKGDERIYRKLNTDIHTKLFTEICECFVRWLRIQAFNNTFFALFNIKTQM